MDVITCQPATNSKITNKLPKKKKNDFVMQNDVLEEFTGDMNEDSNEIDRYINTKLSFSKNNSLLGWWNNYSLIFPQIALLAKSLFGVPASSATSEWVFSSLAQILEKRKQSLNPEIVDDILLIRNFRNI